jgi:GAF domain-containing protein
VRPFDNKQIVTTFADQAVIAIENARLLEELQARNRDLTHCARSVERVPDVTKRASNPLRDAALGASTSRSSSPT